MKLEISNINNPIIDILVAVAAHGGEENCINMVGKYLCGKGFRVRVIQMAYEGTNWTEECMEFHYVSPTRENHESQDFIDGYISFLRNNDKPNLILATGWPMMSFVAKRTVLEIGENIIVASLLQGSLKMYEESGFGGGDYIKCADIHLAINNEIAGEIYSTDAEGMIYRINNPVNGSDYEGNDDVEASLFDLFVKLYVTINQRSLKQYLNVTDSYIIQDKIDIIVPCYNVEKYLRRCMDSILNQSIGLSRMKIIAVNDASTDRTLDILKEYEERYPDTICIIDCDKNMGLGSARNTGLLYVTEKYITFVDSDDCIAKDMLEKMYLSDMCYPSDVISCDFQIFEDVVPKEEYKPTTDSSMTVIDKEIARKQLFADNAIFNPAWAKLFRSSFLIGNEDLRFPVGYRMEDIYFTYMLVAYARVWQHIPQQFYLYYQNTEGIMKSEKSKTYYMDFHHVFEMTIKRYKEIGMFDMVYEEIAYAYYLKAFKNIMVYMAAAFDELPVKNARKLVSYLLDTFPDIRENRYLTEEERTDLIDLLA